MSKGFSLGTICEFHAPGGPAQGGNAITQEPGRFYLRPADLTPPNGTLASSPEWRGECGAARDAARYFASAEEGAFARTQTCVRGRTHGPTRHFRREQNMETITRKPLLSFLLFGFQLLRYAQRALF